MSRNENHKKAEGVNAGLVIGIVFLVLVIVGIIAAGIISFWKRRSGRNTQDDREQLELLNESVIGGSDETVKEAISTGIQLLLRTKVKSMVVLGKFGSGVYSTSCSISERFRELKSNKWEILNCRYTEIPDTVNEKTIVFVYGWFGIWNDDLCSVDKAKTACQSLIRILNETTKVKFIIGMRSDLYMKYHGVLKVDDFQRHLFENEITLDSANTTEDAKFAYFYENMRKKCQKDECVFQNMTCEMIQTGKDNAVGMFLKLNLMERYHDQIHDYKGEWDISMAIRDHFISLENDETKRYVYAWIVYICFIGHFKQTGQYDTKLVEKIGFEIDTSSFNENDKDLCVYFKMRNSYSENNVSPSDKQYVFWHPFIYICAFKFLFEKYPELVMKYCNVDAILQLVRPKEAQISYFEVTADEHCVNLFNERIHDLNLAERYMDNPLIKSRTCGTKSCNNNKTVR